MAFDVWFGIVITGVVWGTIDIFLYMRRTTKIRYSQETLKQAKQEVRETLALSMNNPYPLIQLSSRGEVIFINPSAKDHYTDILSQSINHPILANIRALFNKANAEGVATRDITFNDHVYYQTIIPSRQQDDHTFLVYCYDITERRMYEEKLRNMSQIAERARLDAEKANHARGDFLANMSHELRTPMNGIIGLSDILIDASMPDDQKKLITAVNSSAHNLLLLLNEILDFSKIEAGELTIESIPFDIGQVVMQVAALQRPIAIRKGLQLNYVIDDNFPEAFIGDPSRVQQVLNNLITNAIKFTSSGSITLHVSGQNCNSGKYNVIISVIDTGIGIPKDKQQKVFAKFQQAETSTSREYGGTGLGLAITKDLVQLMGGNISLTSEESKGTTFTISLPLEITDDLSFKEVNNNTTTDIALNTQARILAVDDNPTNLLVIKTNLVKLGFKHFDMVQSGTEALELCKQHAYDLILMDCQMPDMDGFEATKHIRALESDISPVIIAATANAMKGTDEICQKAGMDDYISKPVERKKLYALLQQWLPHDGYSSQNSADNDNQNDDTEQPVSKEEDPVILNWSQLRDLTDGDVDIEQELIESFIQSSESDMLALNKYFDNKSYESWLKIAHKLCGSTSNVGGVALAQTCNKAQKLSPTDITAIQNAHMLICQQYSELCECLIHPRKKTTA